MTMWLVTTSGTVSARESQKRRRNISGSWPACLSWAVPGVAVVWNGAAGRLLVVVRRVGGVRVAGIEPGAHGTTR